MTKLTDAHKEQCKSMYADGKRPCEIIDFFKSTYHINLKSPTLNYIIHGKKKSGVASAEKSRRKAANDRYFTKKRGHLKLPTLDKSQLTALETQQQEEGEEFVNHIHAAFAIHKKGFFRRVEEAVANAAI